MEQRAEASDRRGGVCAGRRGPRGGAPGRRDGEFGLPLAAELRAANGFARVLVAPTGEGFAAPAPMPLIEIEFAGHVRARIAASASPALAAAVVAALTRR